MSQNQKSTLLILTIAALLGLVAGMVGSLVARVYVLEDIFNIPFYGEIDFSNLNYNSPNVVIRGARNVTVEQDVKVQEAINKAQDSIVGIYQKLEQVATSSVLEIRQTETALNLENYYNIKDMMGQGFIITSDGWILTTYKPKGIDFSKPQLSEAEIETINKNFVVISKEKEIYEIDNIIFDSLTSFYFWHINADDLPVKKFVPNEEINVGQLILATNYEGWGMLSTIIGREERGDEKIKNSDKYLLELIVDETLRTTFYDSFVFNLNGDMMGAIDSGGQILTISSFRSVIESILSDRMALHPGLGIYYTELSTLVGDINQKNRGALITKNMNAVSIKKGSAADKAGLLEGDIITHVNNIELNNERTLNRLISELKAGSEVKLTILREEKQIEINVRLDKL